MIMIIEFVMFFLFIQIKSELIMVMEVFRHGAREPIYDWWNAKSFSHWGELSSVGMRQHFNLGQALRKNYIDDIHFLSESFNPDELHVRSTDYNRTIVSALSQLYGLYPLGSGPELPKGLDPSLELPPYNGIKNHSGADFALPLAFQPIPIHVVPLKEDYLLRPYDEICEYSSEITKRIENSEEYKKWNEEFKPTLQELGNLLNLTEEKKKSITINDASDIFDVFMDDIWANKPIPQNISKELWNNLTLIYNLVIYYNLGGILDISRFYATPFFREIIETFDQKLRNPSSLKWKMYSAHDWTIGAFTPALNITDYKCAEEVIRTGKSNALNCATYPDFATSLLLELHQEQSAYFIKIKYNGNYINLCERKEQKCIYSEFRHRLSDFLVDFENICHNSTLTENKGFLTK